MKFLEKIFPAFLKNNLLVYNLAVIILCIFSFFVLLIIGAMLAIFITFGLDQLAKHRGTGLGEGIMPIILLLIILFTVLSFIFSIMMLVVNLKWSTES